MYWKRRCHFSRTGADIAQEFCGAEKEIVEIEGFALREDFFVLREDVGGVAGVGSESVFAQHLGSSRVIFGEADLAEDVARLEIVVIDVERGDGQLDGGELVVVVEDGEIGRKAGGSSFAAEQARAERVECRKPGALGRDSGAHEQIGDAILHLFGGFVGESDGEDGFGGNAFGDEIGHAESDGAGFAGAGSGEDEHRAFGGFGGEALFGIQRVEKVLHWVCEKKNCDMSMLADGERWRKLGKKEISDQGPAIRKSSLGECGGNS